MAVENEVKYVLDDPQGALEAHLTAASGVEGFDILQAYLDKDSRIRRFTPIAGGAPQYIFSFKRKVAGRQIEVETEMLASDFKALLPTAEIVLTKRRFKFADGDVHWDVDFIRDARGGTSFVLAEAEMPETMVEPSVIPPCVDAHLLRYVGIGGTGFGNRRLSDPAYATRALRALRREAAKEGRMPSCDPALYATTTLSMAA